MPGRTPYRGIRFPLEQEIADPSAIQNMTTDINTVLAATALAARNATHRSSVMCWNSPSTSVPKGVLTTANITPVFASDNGAGGPGGTPYWSAGSPTRLTAPATGLYVCWGNAFCNFTAVSVTNWVLASVSRNGANPQTVRASMRGNSSPFAAFVFPFALTAGDFLTVAMNWGGTPAGPLNCDINISLAMIALP